MAEGLPLLGPGTRASPSSGWSRRRLLRTAFWAGLGVGAAGAVAAFGRFLLSAPPSPATGFILLKADQLPRLGDDPHYVREAGCYLVDLRPGEGAFDTLDNRDLAPGAGPGLIALSHRCTHLGCHLPWRPDFQFAGEAGWFRCPCHSATYTKAGVRVFGPAARDMDLVDFTRQDDGSIVIHPKTVRRGRERTGPQS